MNASYVTGGAKAAQAIAKQPKAIHHSVIYCKQCDVAVLYVKLSKLRNLCSI